MKWNAKVYFAVVFLTASVMLRILWYPVVFPDFVQFYDPWLNTLRAHGPAAILSEFSNYNSPYLLLLWLGSLVTSSNMAVIKGINVLFDAVMAFGVYKTVEVLRPDGSAKYFAMALTPILPTVMINSAVWGQNDNILGACMIWALFFCLKDFNRLPWILFGISFAVKMQAIFFAPFLLAIAVNRRKAFVTGPLLAIASCLVCLSPTLLFGDTPARIFRFMFNGMSPMLREKYLSWWIANLWQWFPNEYFDELRPIGVALGLVIAVFIVIYGFRSEKFSKESCLLLASFCLIALPFVLPQMAGRYFYQGEIALFVLAFILPRTAWFVYLIQVVTMATFYIALAGSGVDRRHWTFAVLSIGIMVILAGLVRMQFFLRKSEPPSEIDASERFASSPDSFV